VSDLQKRLISVLDTAGPGLHALLIRLTLREDVAEELMQDLFTGLCGSRGFAKAVNPASYAFRTAMHLAFAWRRSRKQASQPLENAREQAVKTKDPLSKLAADEQLQRVLDALQRLPETQRDVVVMRYIQQLPDEVIAKHVGRASAHVRVLRHRAMVALRRMLGVRSWPPISQEVAHVEH
jgi:RNA polymerase sigma-70 factor (ECF subfamily)